MTQDNPYLQKIEGEWDAFKGKARSKMADARIWTEEKKAEWERESSGFDDTLKNWKDSAADTAEEWKTKAENAWGDLKEKWNDTVEED